MKRPVRLVCVVLVLWLALATAVAAFRGQFTADGLSYYEPVSAVEFATREFGVGSQPLPIVKDLAAVDPSTTAFRYDLAKDGWILFYKNAWDNKAYLAIRLSRVDKRVVEEATPTIQFVFNKECGDCIYHKAVGYDFARFITLRGPHHFKDKEPYLHEGTYSFDMMTTLRLTTSKVIIRAPQSWWDKVNAG